MHKSFRPERHSCTRDYQKLGARFVFRLEVRFGSARRDRFADVPDDEWSSKSSK